jgi:hypothetical protein
MDYTRTAQHVVPASFSSGIKMITEPMTVQSRSNPVINHCYTVDSELAAGSGTQLFEIEGIHSIGIEHLGTGLSLELSLVQSVRRKLENKKT